MELRQARPEAIPECHCKGLSLQGARGAASMDLSDTTLPGGGDGSPTRASSDYCLLLAGDFKYCICCKHF